MPMSDASDIVQLRPDPFIDVGSVELTDHWWGIVGVIPYEGHVLLAVSDLGPTSRPLHR
jgi:hypothetical protein